MPRRLGLAGLLAGCLVTVAASAQTDYPSLINRADSLYAAKNYPLSAQTYVQAFRANGWKGSGDEHYNASCSWALAGNPDSAFHHLQKIASLMTNLDHLTTDKDLVSLHADKRWAILVEQVRRNKEKAEVNLNKPLARELDSIYDEDQKYRLQIEGVEKQYGRESKEMQELWKVIMHKDSLNLRRVTQILDQYGWLGRDVVGGKGNMTLFLVVQHADQRTQEKYLPVMREAVKAGRADARNLALLEDRVALAQGKKQIYGSQIHYDNATGRYFVAPIEDEPNVNKRRAEVGLEPLENYVRRWGIRYTLPKH